MCGFCRSGVSKGSRPANPEAAGCLTYMKKIPILSVLLAFCLVFCAPGAMASSKLQEEMEVNCGSCLLKDMDTDTVLYGQDNDRRIYPASVTKVLTALVVLRHVESGDLSLDQTVTASDTFRKGLTSQAAVAGIVTGERLSLESLLYLLMLPSDCDAANVLAEACSGSVADFAEEMNRTAEELGCTDTHFVNPSGLHSDDHYTTCDDLYRIGKAAYGYETFREIVGTTHYTVPASNTHDARKLHNTNALICGDVYSTYLYEPCTGGKTGSTYPAGYCLLSFAEQDGMRLCCVMMGCNWLINLDGSRDRLQFSESVRLYKWGFENFKPRTVVEKGSPQGSIPVENARAGKDTAVTVTAKDDLTALLPKDVKTEDVTLEPILPQSVTAPVSAGDKLGTLTISLDGEVRGTTDLLAAEDVEEKPKILGRLKEVAHHPRTLIAGRVVLGLFGAVLLFFFVQAMRRRAWRKRREDARKRRG